MFRIISCLFASCSLCLPAWSAPPSYEEDVQPLLTKYCAGCHGAEEANGEFALHEYAALLKGGENGPVLASGKASESRLIHLLEGTAEPVMPPEDEAAPTQQEIAIIKAWIDAGAKGPSSNTAPSLQVPDVKPVGPVRKPIHAAAWSADGSTLALGRYETVELLDSALAATMKVDGLTGHVSFVAFLSKNRLVTAGGTPGLAGEVAVFDTGSGEFVWRNRAHADEIMCGAVDPTGRLLATGSYDQSIILWDAVTGERRGVLKGHNGPVLGLAFHPSKPLLASASGDRTIKLWSTADGARLDTLTEPTKDQLAVAFSPDGKSLVAAGADSRVRAWTISEGKAGTTKIQVSHFAHEGPIVAIAFSEDGTLLVTAGEDRTVKTWNARSMTQIGDPQPQPDWVDVLAVRPKTSLVTLGRLDGTFDMLPLPKVAQPGSEREKESSSVVVRRLPEEQASQSEVESIAEDEPNNEPGTANPLPLPGTVNGVLHTDSDSSSDADCFRFSARAGETWIFETNASRAGSPADTKIDILNLDGTPVERIQLRAVRDSAVNFRGFSAVNPGLRVDYWEEMELNELMYLSGEVCRIFRMPQGPDSDMQLYSVNGQRRSYFDTTPVAHALFEAVYIVEAYPPGVELPKNGLPTFSLPYENDDDSERKLGRDSKLTFEVPADGDYVVRVRDARGFGGPDFKYTLSARGRQPDFSVSLVEKDRSIPVGGGQRLTFKVDRIDGFDGPVSIQIENLPAGVEVSSPVVIEAGHSEAKVSLTALPDTQPPSEEAVKAISVSATAMLEAERVTRPVESFKKLAVTEKPKIIARLQPMEGADAIVITPKGRVRALLAIERNGYEGGINFEIENLPHGVIVDHIGLSGVLVRAEENEREIEFSCADWVQETARPIFAAGKGQGDPASKPVRFVVASPGVDQVAESGR